jgi:malate dehydrogenase (quinone)
VCKSEQVIAHNWANFYGKAKDGTLVISVPLFNSRRINGKQAFVFDPFAVFSIKFLKVFFSLILFP